MNARLFIYYAGHGYTEVITHLNEYRGYITGIDTPWHNGTGSGYAAARLRAISMMRIRAPLAEVLARHILVVFDSCFAGTIFTSRAGDEPPKIYTQDVVERLFGKPSRAFITAGTANERVPAHSPIPELFLAALNGGADRYQKGVISAADIHAYLRARILNLREFVLTPQQGRLPDPAFAEGEFLFRVMNPIAPSMPPQSAAPYIVSPQIPSVSVAPYVAPPLREPISGAPSVVSPQREPLAQPSNETRICSQEFEQKQRSGDLPPDADARGYLSWCMARFTADASPSAGQSTSNLRPFAASNREKICSQEFEQKRRIGDLPADADPSGYIGWCLNQ